MKILFVDNKDREFERFLMLPFAQEHRVEIEHLKSPLGLSKVVEANKDLRLIVLDMLWESDDLREAIPLGADAMKELSEQQPGIPVIIYSIIDDEASLRMMIPEMMRLGAYDWISKDEPKLVRSFRFERAYAAGQNKLKLPASRSLLSPDQQRRSRVHVAVMFADMSGFTALSEELPTNEVIVVLQEFYRLVGENVQLHGGYVDKYIGDAVMAYFGATGRQEEPTDELLNLHVQRCIKAAKKIQAESPAFQYTHVSPTLKNATNKLDPDRIKNIGKIRIGIESGFVEVVRFARGNESEVTVIGTPVNIASRVINLGQPGEVWLGENAYGTGALHEEVGDKVLSKYKNVLGEINRYQLKTF
jgi:class 3 adenylate cyclase